MRSAKARDWLLPVFVCLSLSACETSKLGLDEDDSAPAAPAVIRDTTPPQITFNEPKTDSEDVPVSAVIRVEFDELVDEQELRAGNVEIFSGREVNEGQIASPERTPVLNFSTRVVTGEDLVTGEPIDVEASVLELTLAEGRFVLDTTYTYRVFLPSEDEFNLSDEEKAEREREEEALFADTGVIRTVDEKRAERYDENKFFFIVESGEWEDAQALEFTDAADAIVAGDVSALDIGANDAGQIVAAWLQDVNGYAQVHVSRFDVATGQWRQVAPGLDGSVTMLSAVPDTNALAVKVAVSEQGYVAVSWLQAAAPGQNKVVRLSLFDGTSWQVPAVIGAADQEGDAPSMAFDSAGNLLLAWRQTTSGRYAIRAGIYAPFADPLQGLNPGMNAEQIVSALATGHAFAPKVVANPGLRGVFWTQAESGSYRTLQYALLNEMTRTWGAPRRLDQSDLGHVGTQFSFAASSDNDGLLAWHQFDGRRENLWIRRMSGGAWHSPVPHETDNTGDAVQPTVVVDRDGKFALAWLQSVSGDMEFYVQTLTFADGWSSRQSLQSSLQGEIGAPTLHFDREGHLTALWRSGSNQSGTIKAQRQLRGQPWGSFSSLSGGFGLQVEPVLAPILLDGRLLALWPQSDGTMNRLMMSRYLEQSR
jgi:hypothetical protein